MSDDDQFETDVAEGSNEAGHTSAVLEDDALISSDSAAVLAEKAREREQLQSDIEAFLATGGKITSVDNNVVADPPKKPQSSYGSQPI